jgi:hypothetical protein
MAGSYRGAGSASYHPSVLPGLLIYSYVAGVFSSSKLERAARQQRHKLDGDNSHTVASTALSGSVANRARQWEDAAYNRQLVSDTMKRTNEMRRQARPCEE